VPLAVPLAAGHSVPQEPLGHQEDGAVDPAHHDPLGGHDSTTRRGRAAASGWCSSFSILSTQHAPGDGPLHDVALPVAEEGGPDRGEDGQGAAVEWLNYHHLLYFWTVVRTGGLGPASEDLRLAPSTISVQIHRLEAGWRTWCRSG
jgi:hypothetical protein